MLHVQSRVCLSSAYFFAWVIYSVRLWVIYIIYHEYI